LQGSVKYLSIEIDYFF